jgi:hypothetical protein
MSFYMDWGFSDNPFQTTALPASKLGETLLVGRDSELSQLQLRLCNPPKLPTIEGLNGVGKTSLVNVATFKLFQEHLEDKKNPLFIPCRRSFQLSGSLNVAEFKDQVLREVAQTLFESANGIPDLFAEKPHVGPARLDPHRHRGRNASFRDGAKLRPFTRSSGYRPLRHFPRFVRPRMRPYALE